MKRKNKLPIPPLHPRITPFLLRNLNLLCELVDTRDRMFLILANGEDITGPSNEQHACDKMGDAICAVMDVILNQIYDPETEATRRKAGTR